jgi:hypothetical protein
VKPATVWLDEIGASNERVAQEARLKLGGLTADDAWMTPQLLEAMHGYNGRPNNSV